MIYGSETPENLFSRQIRRDIFAFINPTALKIKSVLEVGTGAWGILMAFKENCISCLGLDFDKRYLDYGISKGCLPADQVFYQVINGYGAICWVKEIGGCCLGGGDSVIGWACAIRDSA